MLRLRLSSLTSILAIFGLVTLNAQATAVINFEDASAWATSGSHPENTISLEDESETYSEGAGSMAVMVEYNTFNSWGGWTDMSLTLDEAFDASTYDELHFKLYISKEPTQNHRTLQFTCDLFEDDGSGAAGEMWRYPEDVDIFYSQHSNADGASWFDVTVPLSNLVQPSWYSPVDGVKDFSALRKFAMGVHSDNDSTAYSMGGEVSDTVKFFIDDLYFARKVDDGQIMDMEEDAADWGSSAMAASTVITMENNAEVYVEGAGSMEFTVEQDEADYVIWGGWTDMGYTFPDGSLALGDATSLRFKFKVTDLPIRKNFIMTFDVEDVNADESTQLFRWGGDSDRPGHSGILNHIDSDYPSGYHSSTSDAMYREIVIPFADMFTPGWAAKDTDDGVVDNIKLFKFGVHANQAAKVNADGDTVSAGVSDATTFFMDDLRLAHSQRVPTWLSTKDEASLATSFSLSQNYPNPFNPTTTIEYSLDQNRDVELSIYSITGELIRTLDSGSKTAGVHKVMWNGLDNRSHQVASGIYIYTISAGEFNATKRLVLLR